MRAWPGVRSTRERQLEVVSGHVIGEDRSNKNKCSTLQQLVWVSGSGGKRSVSEALSRMAITPPCKEPVSSAGRGYGYG